MDISLSTSSWTVYSTLNPEYASLEADIDQFNLDKRNYIYLTEKRPFFIEGFELWRMPFEVLYTRSFMDIDLGNKINFEKGNLKVNAFLISEKDTSRDRFTFERENLAGGTRILYDFKNFSPGVFYIIRGEKEKGYGGDLTAFLPAGFNLHTQFTYSEGKDIYLYLARWGGGTGFWVNSGFEYLDSTFSLSTAYIAYEKNTYSYWVYSGYNWAFDRKIFPSYYLSLGGTDAYFLNGELFERTGSFSIGVSPVSFIDLSYSFDPRKRFYEGTYYNNYLQMVSTKIGVNYPHTFELLAYIGPYFGDYLRFYDMEYRFSLWGKLIGSVEYAIQKMEEYQDERLSFRLTFRPIEKLYLRCFLQKSTISDREDLNLLFQYEFFAGSNLYLVYNYSETEDLRDMIWMSKLAYEFRF